MEATPAFPAPLKRHRSQETTRHKIIKCDGGCHSKSKTWQKGYNSQTSMLQNAATMLIFRQKELIPR